MLSVRQRNLSFKLANKYVLRSWFFPGLWLSDGELHSLRKILESITLSKIQKLPAYGVYLPSREPYMNRIISVVFDRIHGVPVGFGAMVHYSMKVETKRVTVIHLGLVITTTNRLGRDLLFLIYYYPLLYVLTLRRFRPFWVTSVSMEPSIIGAVSDNFGDVFPHYRQTTQPSKLKRMIAEIMVNEYGHEFGMGPRAVFDRRNFVVRGSCRGPSDYLRVDYRHSAKYIVPACNEFCESVLDYKRGDELLQVGEVSFGATVSVITRWLGTKLRRRVCKVKNRFRI
jgi:hypothetical protein